MPGECGEPATGGNVLIHGFDKSYDPLTKDIFHINAATCKTECNRSHKPQMRQHEPLAGFSRAAKCTRLLFFQTGVEEMKWSSSE